MKKKSISFRCFIIFLTTFTTMIALIVVGIIIFKFQSRSINNKAAVTVADTVQNQALRTEVMLQSVEQSLVVLTHVSQMLDGQSFSRLLLSTMDSQPLIRAMYFLDEQAKSFAVWKPGIVDPRNSDYVGIDFSYTPLLQSLSIESQPVWSDKFVSVLAGDTSIGVGVRIGKHTGIAELDLASLLQTVQTASDPDVRLWVIDRQGEVLVDTEQNNTTGILNFYNEPVVALARKGKELPGTVKLRGAYYHPGASCSRTLGWLFLAGVPIGLNNQQIQATLSDILLFSGAFWVITLLFSPWWSYIISSQIEKLRAVADRIAEGNVPGNYKKGYIKELNNLLDYLQLMADKILKREKDLKELNQELEQRVYRRTKELEINNKKLKKSLDDNIKMQDLLVQIEKSAALGRLVAGVAHELNTPIGNTVMAISTLQEEQKLIVREMEEGLRKSSLDRFVAQSEQGLKIAERNIERAAELINSFKHVARDQTSSVRRKFDLEDVVEDVLLTLNPMLKRSPHDLESSIQEGIRMDSYPGEIGQILTNLIINALKHAWSEGQQGIISVIALCPEGTDRANIIVSDNGRGIPLTMQDKIFDPFFTTRMGRGGSGLGLNIALNGARNILGGDLKFVAKQEGGTSFELDIPLVAPVMASQKNAHYIL